MKIYDTSFTGCYNVHYFVIWFHLAEVFHSVWAVNRIRGNSSTDFFIYLYMETLRYGYMISNVHVFSIYLYVGRQFAYCFD